MGVTEGQVGRVEGAEAAAMGDGAGMIVLGVHEGDDFMKEIVFELKMALDAAARVSPESVETFVVHAIDAKKLELAGVDLAGENLDHADVFVLKEAAIPGREDEYFGAGVAKDKQFHITL